MTIALGIDFGTSGARAIALALPSNIALAQHETSNTQVKIVAETNLIFPANIPVNNLASIWQESLFTLISQIPEDIRQQITRISIDGTSSTVFLCDRFGVPIGIPLIYNDDRAKEIVSSIHQQAPENHPVISATSSLAKLLWLLDTYGDSQDYYLLHQADWLGFLLHQQIGISDYHKIGRAHV